MRATARRIPGAGLREVLVEERFFFCFAAEAIRVGTHPGRTLGIQNRWNRRGSGALDDEVARKFYIAQAQ
jgi:hypothetical protein